MRKVRRIISVFMIVYMIFAMNAVSFAKDTTTSPTLPDYSRKGSITVDILSSNTGKGVSGGTLTLYKVAVASQIDGDNIFQFSDDFRKSGISLAGINEEDKGAGELASKLASYVDYEQVAGNTVTVNTDGRTEWKQLELGLYLIVNTTAAEGYAPVNAFLVTVPRYLNGSYVYDVEANPKLETADMITAGTSESKPKTPVLDSKLPQTGQLWWPVPILAIVGMLFIISGCYIRRCHRDYDVRC